MKAMRQSQSQHRKWELTAHNTVMAGVPRKVAIRVLLLSSHRTKEMCVPSLRWLPEQSRQMKMPYVAEAQVGLRAWQSKHVCRGGNPTHTHIQRREKCVGAPVKTF